MIFMMFDDRSHAGRMLAEKLKEFGGENTVVYALPRGGVVLGYEVAKVLGCPLDLVVSRKVGHPMNSEYAVCAVTENAPPICNQYEVASIDQGWLESEVNRQKAEIRRRKTLYPSPNISPKGKKVIIIDDGIATGLTLFSAIEEVKAQEPAMLIVAVPVSPADTAEKIRGMVDRFICLDIPMCYLGAVGMYYASFPQVSDEEVIELLNKAGKK
jgi:predicted phosphoribosyltransferase